MRWCRVRLQNRYRLMKNELEQADTIDPTQRARRYSSTRVICKEKSGKGRGFVVVRMPGGGKPVSGVSLGGAVAFCARDRVAAINIANHAAATKREGRGGASRMIGWPGSLTLLRPPLRWCARQLPFSDNVVQRERKRPWFQTVHEKPAALKRALVGITYYVKYNGRDPTLGAPTSRIGSQYSIPSSAAGLLASGG